MLLAYDNDEAGKKATERDDVTLYNLGLEVFQIRFPAGMDVNEYAAKVHDGDASGRITRWVWSFATRTGWAKAPRQPLKPKRPIIWPLPASESPKKLQRKQLSRMSPSITRQANQASRLHHNQPKPNPSTKSLSKSPLRQLRPHRQNVEATIGDKEISFTFGNRSYRVRGFEKVSTSETMKVNLLVRREELFHVDTFDLYASRTRERSSKKPPPNCTSTNKSSNATSAKSYSSSNSFKTNNWLRSKNRNQNGRTERSRTASRPGTAQEPESD